jgi:hypothetical protein
MITLSEIPNGLKEIIEVYGNPDLDGDCNLDSSFIDHCLQVFSLPFPMRVSWNPIQSVKRIQAHYAVGPVMVDALKEILDFRGWQYLQDNQFDYYGGCFNWRPKRGGSKISTHCWAISIDINPHIAPLGGDPTGQPEFIVSAFERRGFEWGGRWKRPDGMHFQACSGY